MDISIIVATRNRSDKLALLVKSLESMVTGDHFQWELLIVNNGSTDQTGDLCTALAGKNPDRYRCLCENRRGKSRSLNRGIDEARGNILAFTDDDCIVGRTWVEEIRKVYRSDPDLAVAGGRVELFNKQDDALTLCIYPEERVLSSLQMLFPDPLVIGCNLAAKKEVFQRVGGFDPSLGPGTEAVVEDVDFIYRAYRKGFKVGYFPKMVVYHNHGRQSAEERRKLLFKYHIGRGAFYSKYFFADRKVARLALRDLGRALKNLRPGRGVKSSLRLIQALFKGAKIGMKSRGRKSFSSGFDFRNGHKQGTGH